jgi:hypothetical protein
MAKEAEMNNIILQGITLTDLQDMIRKEISKGQHEEILNRKQAAKFLGVHESSVDAYYRDKGLKAYTRGSGRNPVFKKSDLMDFLKPL